MIIFFVKMLELLGDRLEVCVSVLRNKTGDPFQIDPNFVGSPYFMVSKLTLCMIRVSLDKKNITATLQPLLV